MSNSALVTVTDLSPYCTQNRTHAIDTITIHCAVAQCSAERLGEVFREKRASANYGIGYDGSVGLFVDEDDVSWCSSDTDNDNRAITIEMASDNTYPYAVTDKAHKAMIALVADICQRNGINKLVWSDNKNQRVNHENGCNMTVHRDYANKSCPGDWLYERMGEIAEEVNAVLETDKDAPAKWAESAWVKAKAKEVLDGTRPTDVLTRQELAVVLDRLGLLD